MKTDNGNELMERIQLARTRLQPIETFTRLLILGSCSEQWALTKEDIANLAGSILQPLQNAYDALDGKKVK
jgi:hypothetical protein